MVVMVPGEAEFGEADPSGKGRPGYLLTRDAVAEIHMSGWVGGGPGYGAAGAGAFEDDGKGGIFEHSIHFTEIIFCSMFTYEGFDRCD